MLDNVLRNIDDPQAELELSRRSFWWDFLLTGLSREYWFLRCETLTRRRANTLLSVVDYMSNVRPTDSSSIRVVCELRAVIRTHNIGFRRKDF